MPLVELDAAGRSDGQTAALSPPHSGRHAPKPEREGDPYAKLKERARARNVALAMAGRDIGELVRQADRPLLKDFAGAPA